MGKGLKVEKRYENNRNGERRGQIWELQYGVTEEKGGSHLLSKRLKMTGSQQSLTNRAVFKRTEEWNVTGRIGRGRSEGVTLGLLLIFFFFWLDKGLHAFVHTLVHSIHAYFEEFTATSNTKCFLLSYCAWVEHTTAKLLCLSLWPRPHALRFRT